jgi:hypothetical protein
MDKVEKFPLLFHSVIIIVVSISQSTYSYNLFFFSSSSFYLFLVSSLPRALTTAIENTAFKFPANK